MFSGYDINAIPIIFEIFKVKKIVSSGLFNEDVFNEIKQYCDLYGAEYIAINLNSDFEHNGINGNSLEILENILNYDVILINDDPNWYTILNELNIVNKNNDEFPLVFLLNNIFPHKRRDAYASPDIIPPSFINEYSDELNISGDIFINDGFYHAVDENTPKNGVLTAIEDFLHENPNIGVMDSKFTGGITILYFINTINKIRIDMINQQIKNSSFEEDLIDIQAENQVLKNYIGDNVFDANNEGLEDLKLKIREKDNKIAEYENKIEQNNSEIAYKDSKLNRLNSEINLKQSQINNNESQLFNKELVIEDMNNKLQDVNAEIFNLNNELSTTKEVLFNKELVIEDMNNKLQDVNAEIFNLNNELSTTKEVLKSKEREYYVENNNLNDSILEKEELLKNKEIEFNNRLNDMQNAINQQNEEIIEMELNLNSIKNQNSIQLSKLHSKDYCIKCYKDEIKYNKIGLEYYKKRGLLKNMLFPLSYVILIFKSNLNELSLNFKLYKLLKNSDCFDVGYYLKDNADLFNSMWCKYFSPELHYVCYGFNENRKFNKKFFNRKSKLELLEYLITCNK